MKYLSEYQDPLLSRKILADITAIACQPVSIMEVCGSQTHTIVGGGIDQLLPSAINLIHGPGCPVCVTPVKAIDQVIHLALQPNHIICSYGDMLRVPGTGEDLLSAKARGADVRTVFSSLDVLKIALDNPNKKVIFFAIGFETTTYPNAALVDAADQMNVTNLFVLVSQVLVPPALEAILHDPDCQIQALLAPGHVCAIMGYRDYEPIAQKYHLPIVVTGFEPVDILEGIYLGLQAVYQHNYTVINQYHRVVSREGNLPAQSLIKKIFKVSDQTWRGIGTIPASGLILADKYARFDAHQLLQRKFNHSHESPDCQAGLVLQGKLKPPMCPAFGKQCTPNRPLGAPMVSSEGACAAYFRSRKLLSPSP